MNVIAIVVFLGFIAISLLITAWAARRTQSTDDYFSGGSQFSGFQNGLAIAGDFLSAATLLGFPALVILFGTDSLVYAIGAAAGWPVVMLLLASKIRKLGKYTFTDVLAVRLANRPIRIMAAVSTLTIVSFYLIAQMVGAGRLIEVVFGLPYWLAINLIGMLIVVYVAFGGMLATTAIQIVKAVMILLGGTILVWMVMARVDYNLIALFDLAVAEHDRGEDVLRSGNMITNPIAGISLALAFLFGPAGLPHILMRFFTVPNESESRKSAFYATLFITYFQIIMFVCGIGAIAFVINNADYLDANGGLIGGLNMAVLHLSDLVAGSWLLGFISAVSFATILAVVSGLALSAAAAVSHDLYTEVICNGEADADAELKVSRITVVCVGIMGIILGMVFRDQNVAFLATLSLALAASVNFPILVLAIYWCGLTTRGALAGGYSALTVAVVLVISSKVIWVDVFGFHDALYPYSHPTLFSAGAGFVIAWLVSITDRTARAKQERLAFHM